MAMHTLQTFHSKVHTQNTNRLYGDHSSVAVEPISLNSIGKPLQTGAFTKRNWTPASIRIVSKLVSSYGADDGT